MDVFMKKILMQALFFIMPLCVFFKGAVGYDFLRTQVGARPSSMGGAFIAVPGDVYNVIYNPAGLSALSQRQGALTYLNHLLDFQSGFLGYAQPVWHGVAAAAFNFYDFGNFDGKNENNEDTGEFGANGLVFSIAYAQDIIKNLSLGGNAKYIRFQIDNFTETAIAVDAGLLFAIPRHALNIGL